MLLRQKRRLPPDLPTDLLSEIFSRLPVKSVLRFRSVSKTWCCTIEDPKFVKSYKNRSKSQISVVLLEHGKVKFTTRCSTTFEVNAERDFPIEIGRAREVIGCVDGLFLFERRRLLLWNPSIRRARILPDPLRGEEDRTTWNVGIGYDPWIKDYKHVRISYNRRVVVYTVGTNSWKTIPFKIKGDRSWILNPVDLSKWQTACFRGVLYSIAMTSTDTADKSIQKWKQHLVSFDLSTEEFSSANLPEVKEGVHVDRWLFKCASDDSRLALVASTPYKRWIWWAQEEGGDVTWSKRYTLASTHIWSVFNIDVKMMSTSGDKASMKLLLYSGGAVRLCNAGHELKLHCDFGCGWATSYVESMALFN